MYLCVSGAVLVPVVEIQSATIRNVVTDAYLTRFAPATKARLTDRGSYHEMKYQSKLANAGEIKVLVSESRPEIMLAKWDEEVAMIVTYANLKARGQRDLLTNTVKWKGNQEEVHAYPLEPAFGMEDGGFEIEIELLEPPQKNVFDFRIAGAEDLDFFYQPPLTEEYIPENYPACLHRGKFCYAR